MHDRSPEILYSNATEGIFTPQSSSISSASKFMVCWLAASWLPLQRILLIPSFIIPGFWFPCSAICSSGTQMHGHILALPFPLAGKADSELGRQQSNTAICLFLLGNAIVWRTSNISRRMWRKARTGKEAPDTATCDGYQNWRLLQTQGSFSPLYLFLKKAICESSIPPIHWNIWCYRVWPQLCNASLEFHINLEWEDSIYSVSVMILLFPTLPCVPVLLNYGF